MKNLSRLKADTWIASAFSIFFYFLFVSTDIYTTYLTTPDLKFEGNWVIRHFNLDWCQIIIKDSLTVLFVSIGFLFALRYIHSYYRMTDNCSRKKIKFEILNSKRLLLSLVIVSFLYFHLTFSAFLSVNNVFHYIFLYGKENPFYNLSAFYINHIMMRFPYIFIWYRIFFIVIGISLAIYNIKRIRDKYLKVLA